MAKFKLNTSDRVRRKITLEQKREIKKLYDTLLVDVRVQQQVLKGDNVSSVLRRLQLAQLEKRLAEDINTISRELNEMVKNGIEEMSTVVVNDSKLFLYSIGFKEVTVKDAWLHVPKEIVENISAGKIYDREWFLSDAIWKNSQKLQSDISKIIAEGTAQGKSAYDVAKDLERYVNPSARKDWKWSRVYPNTNKRVDYNAQRLARTLISHAYQQTFIQTTIKNPFIEDYIWISAGIHGRTCDICQQRDGQHFKKDELPEDHPNGMCTYEAYISKSDEQIVDELAKWYKEPIGSYPDLDAFAESLM